MKSLTDSTEVFEAEIVGCGGFRLGRRNQIVKKLVLICDGVSIRCPLEGDELETVRESFEHLLGPQAKVRVVRRVQVTN